MRIPFFSRKPEPVLEQKKVRAYAVNSPMAEASWMKRDYSSYALEGYSQNVIVHSAINRVARAISSIEFYVDEDGKRETSHPILDLLDRPNPLQTRTAWWEQKIGYLMLAGETFEERVRVRGRTTQLWNLRPDRTTPIQHDSGLPAGFIFKVANKPARRWAASTVTGESDVRHLKLFNPLDDWHGLSPISAAAFAVDQHNMSMSWVQRLLQNSARPSGAMVISADQPLSDDEYQRLKDEIETQYSGHENAGRPMLLEGGLDWKQMGLSPIDMEILKTREMAARDISLAFGVPPLLLNIPGDNTYANYREARLGFYEDTILPLLDYLVQEFNVWIAASEYGNARLRPDYDSIEAIAEKRMKLWAMADASDDITLNESRALKNLPPLPNPLGSTLMSEIRAGTRGNSPKPTGEKDMFRSAYETAYGK